METTDNYVLATFVGFSYPDTVRYRISGYVVGISGSVSLN
jgi:hypothetical protein